MAKGKKTCPECKNEVIARKNKCNFCGYEFVKKTIPTETSTVSAPVIQTSNETTALETKVDELTNMVSQLTNALVIQKKKLETIENSKSNSSAKEYLDEIEKRKRAASNPAVVKPMAESAMIKEWKRLKEFFMRNERSCPNKNVEKDIAYGIMYKRNAFLRDIIRNNISFRQLADKEKLEY